MKSLSGVGLAMSLVFGFLLMALLAELYYLLWWKRRIANARIEDGAAKEFFFMFCGKNPPPPPSSLPMKPLEVSRPDNLVRHEPQPRTDTEEEEEEAELMRLSGPARFLCTIKEETMEDLESDDGRKGRMETPYFTPPLTPDVNPFLPAKSEIFDEPVGPHTPARQDSPPRPSFKFLRDAEEKAAQNKDKEEGSSFCSEEELPYKDEENGSFITLVFPRSREGEFVSEFSSSVSSSSQVLPLSSSPSSFVSPPSK
nr:Optomotor-blind protein [Ipomoea batatas]